jgi:hypothetical protein
MIGRAIATRLTLFAFLLTASCGFEHRTRSGPLAAAVDSLLREDPVGECGAPRHPVYDDVTYHVCYSGSGRTGFHVDSIGRVLSVAETWSGDTAIFRQADQLSARLDRRASELVFAPGAGPPLGRRWREEVLCHSLVVDSAEMVVLYIRTLRRPSDGCERG